MKKETELSPEDKQRTERELNRKLARAFSDHQGPAITPDIKVTIGNNRGKEGEMDKKQPNVFRGTDAPAKAIKFLKDKFPGQTEKGEC